MVMISLWFFDQKYYLQYENDTFYGGFRYLDAGAGDDTITVQMPTIDGCLFKIDF